MEECTTMWNSLMCVPLYLQSSGRLILQFN
jgi:hypothetical protein